MEERSRAIWERLGATRSVALLDPGSPEECVRSFELLDPLGVVLEIALRNEHALPGIEAVLRSHPDALLLAGTVLTRKQAESALALGVAGVVSPDYVPAVVEVCVDADVMCIPGGLADCGKQLVQKAELYGCTLEGLRRDRPWQWVYKIFPAAANEASLWKWVAAWRGVYPGIRLLYTGGVTPENVGRLAGLDPEGIFCGSSLARHLDDPARAREDVGRWLRAVATGRNASPSEAAVFPPPGVLPESLSRGIEAASLTGEARRSGGGPGGVVTFGEIMLRLSPPPGVRLRSAGSYQATNGGAEANVAAALAQWGVPSRFLTALPEHDLADAALDRLRGLGVDISAVLRREGRMGVYFLERGASQRPPRVIYDRAGSSFAGLGPGEVDWEAALAGAAWFHLTGITPALGAGPAAAAREGVRAAKDRGLTVSFDLNYRSSLWSRAGAREVLTPFLEDVDVLVGNLDQLASIFGEEEEAGDRTGGPGVESPGEAGSDDEARFEGLGRLLVRRFGLRLAALTLRRGALASRATWQAFLHDGERLLPSVSYTVDVVDGVGAGDAFAAGLIYGTLTGRSRQDALEFGAAAARLKMTMDGDVLLATAEEVEGLARGGTPRGIRR